MSGQQCLVPAEGLAGRWVSGGRGPVYDDAMKFLAEHDLPALLSVLGVPAGGARRLNAELTASTMRPDLLAVTPTGIVHVEFVKDLTPDLGVRMVDYWLRLRRAHPDTPITQYVLALGDIRVPDHYRDIDSGRVMCGWTVVRISDLDPATLLARPGTAALAALGRGTPEQRAQVLVAAAAELITARADPRRRRDLLVAAETLASIVLHRDTIITALKEADMPVLFRDTPLVRELLEEVREEARQEGREAVVHLSALMLRHRFGDDPRIDTIAVRLAALPDDERITRLTTATSLDELQR